MKTLPPEFLDHWAALTGRCASTAHARMVLLFTWEKKLPIPGYDGHPGWPSLPVGWSLPNLRLHAIRHTTPAAK